MTRLSHTGIYYFRQNASRSDALHPACIIGCWWVPQQIRQSPCPAFRARSQLVASCFWHFDSGAGPPPPATALAMGAAEQVRLAQDAEAILIPW